MSRPFKLFMAALSFILLASIAHGEKYSHDLPRVTINDDGTATLACDLYNARYRLGVGPEVVNMVIYPEHFAHRGDKRNPRSFWTPKILQDDCLSSSDYAKSGFDIGHIYALAWAQRSGQWNAVNCMAVMTPQYPDVNRIIVRLLEDSIFKDALTHDSPVFVRVEIEYGDDTMDGVTHPHCIPTLYRYIHIGAGGNPVTYEIPNVEEPVSRKYQDYRKDD